MLGARVGVVFCQEGGGWRVSEQGLRVKACVRTTRVVRAGGGLFLEPEVQGGEAAFRLWGAGK